MSRRNRSDAGVCYHVYIVAQAITNDDNTLGSNRHRYEETSRGTRQNAHVARNRFLRPRRLPPSLRPRAGSWMKFRPASKSSTRAGVFHTRTWRTGSARGVASVNGRRLACDHRLVAASHRASGSSPRVHRARQSERRQSSRWHFARRCRAPC